MSDRLAVADECEVVHRGWEVAVRIEGSLRQVENVLHLIAAADIGVLAHCSYGQTNGARLLLVPVNAEAACAVMRGAGYECELHPIIWVTTPYRVGMAASLGVQLEAGGVDILYTYAAWEDGQRAVFVFKTSQDDLAFQILHTALEGCAAVRPPGDGVESVA